MNIDYELLESIATQIEAVEGDCVGYIKTIRNCVEQREKDLLEAYKYISKFEFCGCPVELFQDQTSKVHHVEDCYVLKCKRYVKKMKVKSCQKNL